jgi:hypothetical protein
MSYSCFFLLRQQLAIQCTAISEFGRIRTFFNHSINVRFRLRI